MADDNKGFPGFKNTTTPTETKALDGVEGQNRTPAFGNQAGGLDRNTNLVDSDQVDTLKEGAESQSAGAVEASTGDFQNLLAASVAGDTVPEGHEDTTQYSSFPISRLRLGSYQFEGGLLRLKNGEEVEKFESLLTGLDPATRNSVKVIDRASGVAVAKAFQATQSKSTQGVDHSGNGPTSPKPSE